MVYLNTILESLITVCRQSERLPAAVTYASIELDTEDHANVSPPIIEFTPTNVEKDSSRNTELVGREFDDDGRPIGYRFTQWFTADVNAQVLTVSQTDYTHRELSNALAESLAVYRSDAPFPVHQALPDPDTPDGALSDVNWLYLRGFEPDNEFSMSPSTRERSFPIEIGFTHELSTSELGIEYGRVETVDLTTCVRNPRRSLDEDVAEPSEPITDG